jgi:hypothetical protein
MVPQKPYELIYDFEVRRHVSKIPQKYHRFIRGQIKDRLRYEPESETRNRKPLSRPSVFGSAWELRFGPDNRFRVFYRVNQEARQVYILAVGIKVKNQLFVGGEVFKL